VTKRHPHFIEDEQFRILAVLRKLGRGPDIRLKRRVTVRYWYFETACSKKNDEPLLSRKWQPIVEIDPTAPGL